MIHYITTEGLANAWVANELRVVQREGIPFVLHAMRKVPPVFFAAEWAERFDKSKKVLYPLPWLGTAVSVMCAPIIFGRRFAGALLNALFGKRESWRARLAGIAHLFVACHWARSLRGEHASLVHAQWVHSCGTIGMYGAWLLDVPFSFTGHATDLFRDRVALRDKIRRAEFIICISSFHREFYKKHGARDEQLHLAYCGIDVSDFAPPPSAKRPGERLRILSSGRLVEKKGFAYLIDACKLLADRGVPFECVIAGSGPCEEALQLQIERLGLADCVAVSGQAIKQEKIPAFMHTGDVYCLPCVPAPDGDIDGLPQMLMEAMACGLPAISTRLVGIPDLVVDGRTGILVEPGQPEQLAEAIRSIYKDPGLANRLARAGREWVVERFDIRTCLAPLLEEFRKRLDPLELERQTRPTVLDTAIIGAGKPS